MSDGGSPGPISGALGGGTSPNPEAMIASSSSVKSKSEKNSENFESLSKIEKKWSKELYLYESVHLARADADETGNRTQTKPNKVELT